jgi:hypothetical protein
MVYRRADQLRYCRDERGIGVHWGSEEYWRASEIVLLRESGRARAPVPTSGLASSLDVSERGKLRRCEVSGLADREAAGVEPHISQRRRDMGYPAITGYSSFARGAYNPN